MRRFDRGGERDNESRGGLAPRLVPPGIARPPAGGSHGHGPEPALPVSPAKEMDARRELRAEVWVVSGLSRCCWSGPSPKKSLSRPKPPIFVVPPPPSRSTSPRSTRPPVTNTPPRSPGCLAPVMAAAAAANHIFLGSGAVGRVDAVVVFPDPAAALAAATLNVVMLPSPSSRLLCGATEPNARGISRAMRAPWGPVRPASTSRPKLRDEKPASPLVGVDPFVGVAGILPSPAAGLQWRSCRRSERVRASIEVQAGRGAPEAVS